MKSFNTMYLFALVVTGYIDDEQFHELQKGNADAVSELRARIKKHPPF